MIEQNIKQRLVGAAILISIGVIFIPLLLRQPVGIRLGNNNSADVEIRASKEQGLSITDVQVEHGKEDSQALNDGQANLTQIFSESERLIQIGSFSYKKNAQHLRDKVVSFGYKAFIETVQRGTTIIYKVRVDVGSEGNIQNLKQKLEHQLGAETLIILPSDNSS
ncbi:sporulation domain-containing protein [Candidatus Nitrosoglobus terrae]|uniref:Sporulation domain-containing protein n=1 Tax=Candidatus Nitrosoglobus terrae TaxID=1630141 RepID=A0A1Q2SMT2_9GAMM|nr:SPOR domain-containing protein [Candidatus Nitrosoglobus terrae]BAW80423.1 sporulation domain-containing protein [Candidatus Nitrosoglobus terrae]